MLRHFNGHQRHPRLTGRRGDPLGSRRIVLVDANEGLHLLGWNELGRMTDGDPLARPVVRTATGFHGNRTGGELGEKCGPLRPRESFLEYRIPLIIHAVNLENRFGQIQTHQSMVFMDAPHVRLL